MSGHFVPTSFRTILVISFPLFGHFVPSNNHFVPSSFRTHFGHFVPSLTGYEMTFESQFVPKSFRTYFGYFVPTLVISYLGSRHIKIIYLNTYFHACVGGTIVCSRHLCHMTKMAATNIYGKILQKYSSREPAGRFPRNLVCSIGDSCPS